jgi:hypothetical protein
MFVSKEQCRDGKTWSSGGDNSVYVAQRDHADETTYLIWATHPANMISDKLTVLELSGSEWDQLVAFSQNATLDETQLGLTPMGDSGLSWGITGSGLAVIWQESSGNEIIDDTQAIIRDFVRGVANKATHNDIPVGVLELAS